MSATDYVGTWQSHTLEYLAISKPKEPYNKVSISFNNDGTGVMRMKALLPMSKKFVWHFDGQQVLCSGVGSGSFRLVCTIENGELAARTQNFKYYCR